MTWMTDHTRNDFKTFRGTLPPLLSGDYHTWPRWQVDHIDYLFQLSVEAVARANCGVEEHLRAIWGNHEATFALYLRSFAHEGLVSGSPRGEILSFDLSGIETIRLVCNQLSSDAAVLLIYNPAGSTTASLAVPADGRVLGVAVDDTWAETVRRFIRRADIIILAASVMTGGVETELALLRETLAQERTVLLLAEPPDTLTLAFHRTLHQAPLDIPAPRAVPDQFPDFTHLIDRWDARDAGAATGLALAIQGVRDSRRPIQADDPPKLPPIEVDESLIAQAQHEIALGIREANTDQTKRAILHFTAVVYLGYEACSIPTMLDAYAQLAHWSAALSDPLASDYRRLHESFAVGVQHGFAAMADRLQRRPSNG